MIYTNDLVLTKTSWEAFFYLFICHVFCRFFHKISGNSMGMWLEEKPDYFGRLIWEKARQPTRNEERRFADGLIGEMQSLEVPFDDFWPFSYIDNTNVKTCRPGAGPVDDGRRRENAHDLQRAFYSTYIKANGLKGQCVCIPNGMWANVWGSSMRHNDKGVLNMSGLTDFLIDLFAANNMQLPGGAFPSMYADTIYENTLVVTRRIEDPANEMEDLLNLRMNACRQVIEHWFGDLFQLFDLLNRKKKFRIYRKGKEMYAIVLVCFFYSKLLHLLLWQQVIDTTFCGQTRYKYVFKYK